MIGRKTPDGQKLTAVSLGKAIGLKPGRMRAIINKDTPEGITIESIMKLSTYLDCPVGELVVRMK